MKLWEYLDFEKLQSHIEEGLVEMRFHKEYPLFILCYGRKAQREWKWDDVTRKCRGLIVQSDTYEIISRPFEKFFEFGQEVTWQNVPAREPVILEKLNGSLGILYVHNGVHAVASKGSFHSEFANWATEWYQKNVIYPQWPQCHTVVFEMICEHIQKHAIDYGGVPKLVLLALINNVTGEEADYNTLYHWAKINGMEVPGVFGKQLTEILAENGVNAEGYVASWPIPGQPPLKVKVKFQEFKRLRRLLHDATPKNIFRAIATEDNKKLDDWQYNSTPWIKNHVQEWIDKFKREYVRIHQHCRTIMLAGLTEYFAQFLLQNHKPYAGVCFAMVNEGDYQSAIWELVEPLSKAQAPVTRHE